MEDTTKLQAKKTVENILNTICDKMAIDRCVLFGLIEEIMVDEGFVDMELIEETLH